MTDWQGRLVTEQIGAVVSARTHATRGPPAMVDASAFPGHPGRHIHFDRFTATTHRGDRGLFFFDYAKFGMFCSASTRGGSPPRASSARPTLGDRRGAPTPH